MTTCWYCYWGWPQSVADIFLQAKADLDGNDDPLLYGPGHIVWSDENFDSAPWCLDNFDRYRDDLSDEEAAIVRRSLEQLAALPESVCTIVPSDYDGRHPAQYPPAPGVIVVKV